MRPFLRRVTVACFLILAPLASVPLTQHPPTFRSGVDVVTVDVTVVDDHGMPLPEFFARDFELEVAGDTVPCVLWSPRDARGPRP